MKQQIVGSYYTGFDQVEIVLREGQGAEFYMTPEKGKIARIKIGADHYEFKMVLESLLHEVYESILFKKGCAFEPSLFLLTDTGRYRFFMSHDDFSDINAKAAECLLTAIPDVRRAWVKWRKESKTETKGVKSET